MNYAQTIAGRYRIEGRLGVGGMSTVHLAFDQRLERNVAIKLLAEHLADDATFVSRFRREALSAARLVHPNIVQVFDFGFDERQHQHFIVMEHVAGQSCAELLRDHGHLEVDEAVDDLSQSCKGLEYAHRNGVVHRDVKPGNLLRLRRRRRQARRLRHRPRDRSVEHHPGRLGARHRRVPCARAGPRRGGRPALRHLLAGRGRLPAAVRTPALRGGSLSELTLKQQREAPERLDVLDPEVPRELAQAVSMALSIDAAARPPDAMVFAEALQNGAKGRAPSDTAPTAHLGSSASTEILADRSPPTAATRVAAAQAAAPRTRQPPPRRRIEPQRAAPRPAPGYAPATAAPAARRDRSGGRAFRRFVIFLVVALLFTAAVVVAVAIATSTSNTVVHARTVVGKDAQDAIDQVKSLVNQYTK